MTSVGVMASAVVIAPCTSVLREPFDGLAAWTGSGTVVIGRNGTGIQVTNTAHATYTIPAANESATVTVGFAVRLSNIGSAPDILRLNSDANVTTHTRIVVNATGSISAMRSASQLGVSASGLIAINTWYYVEVQATLHDTAGAVTVRLNGTVVLNLTNVDTKNAGTKTGYDTIDLTPGALSTTIVWDDLYLTTGSGCAFQGDQNMGKDALLLEPFNNFTDGPWNINGSPTIVAGRHGTAASVSTTTSSVNYRILPEAEYLTIGFAWQSTVIGSLRKVVVFDSDVGTVLQYQVRTNGTAFTFDRGATTVGTSSGVTVVANTWYFIELQVRLHDTLGSAIMRVNGTEVMNLSGIDTRASVGTMIDTVELRPSASGTTNLYDDLYITTGAGASFKGDINLS